MIKKWLKPYWEGPKILQLGFFWILFVVLVIYLVNYPAGLVPWRFFGTITSLVLLLFLNIIWVNPKPTTPSGQPVVRQWLFLILSAVLIFAAAWMSNQNEVIYLWIFVCAQASFMRGVWPSGVVFGAVMLVIWSVYQIELGKPFSAIMAEVSALATGIGSVLLLMAFLSRYMLQTKRAEALLGELQAANAELEAAHKKEKDLAIAEERVRLARDIHDGLGHHLTVLSIQLQAADKLVERDPQAAAQAIQVCRAEAQAALEEVRHSVSILRKSPAENQPLPETLASLVKIFSQHTGLHTSFEVAGTAVELPSFFQETIFRAVQEGLTNTHKHAINVQQVSIRLVYESKSVRLSIQDDGQGPAEKVPSIPPGFGLEGLRERATRLGGTFRSGPHPAGGFETELCLPVEGKENDPGTSR